jgi:hypothetical protein
MENLMIVVRTEIRCKWGRVDEALKLSRKSYERTSGQLSAIKRIRLLTDMSGPHDTVIVEAEVESMDAYFAMLDAIFASPDFQAAQADQAAGDLPYESAERNFYKVEAVFE